MSTKNEKITKGHADWNPAWSLDIPMYKGKCQVCRKVIYNMNDGQTYCGPCLKRELQW